MENSNGLDDLDSILEGALEDFEALDAASSPLRGQPQSPSATPAAPRPSSSPSPSPAVPPRPDFNQFSETMRQMAENAQKLEEESKGEGGEDLLEKLMKDFDQNEGYKGMVEGMMKQLISKDVLYEPMKEMYEKYPKWLSANKSRLPAAEYQNYVKQFGYIEQIMYIYDSQGDAGFSEVLRLMREMQDCGQVPVEIVKQLAPDMEFDAEGMPKFPGMENLPGGGNPDQCSVM